MVASRAAYFLFISVPAIMDVFLHSSYSKFAIRLLPCGRDNKINSSLSMLSKRLKDLLFYQLPLGINGIISVFYLRF